jgi:hypothetical protein
MSILMVMMKSALMI